MVIWASGRGRAAALVALAWAVCCEGSSNAATSRLADAVSPTSRAPVLVAIDPGHGGTNLGAAGPIHGLYEKNVTLALAERVQALLADPGESADSPTIAVLLCRNSDELVPIRARARCAAETGARLFITLHANAVPPGVSPQAQNGYEIFVLGPREVEDDVALAALAERNDARAAFAAHQVRASAEQSIRLAGVLSRHLTRELGASGWRGVKQSGAALDVLRGARTAAVLVEVGFLSHPAEGARLMTSAGREPIARALAAGIRAFVDTPSTHLSAAKPLPAAQR